VHCVTGRKKGREKEGEKERERERGGERRIIKAKANSSPTKTRVSTRERAKTPNDCVTLTEMLLCWQYDGMSEKALHCVNSPYYQDHRVEED
jgi:hypothetical protein